MNDCGKEGVNLLEGWKITDNRFVAFLDILGFKDLVARYSHEDVLKKLMELSAHTNYIENTEFSKDKIYITKFSDSIIIFSWDDSYDSVFEFIYAVRYIMCRVIELKLGVKGGMAFGKITVDSNSQLYFGQPLIDAYLLEEELQYYGVILHHTAEEKILSITVPPNSGFKFNFMQIPTKLRQGTVNHLNVNWFDLARNVKNKGYDLRKYLNDIKLTVSGAPRRYLDNTMEALEQEEKIYNGILGK